MFSTFSSLCSSIVFDLKSSLGVLVTFENGMLNLSVVVLIDGGNLDSNYCGDRFIGLLLAGWKSKWPKDSMFEIKLSEMDELFDSSVQYRCTNIFVIFEFSYLIFAY